MKPLSIDSIRLHKGGRRVAVTDSDKDTSLLQHGINYNRKSFMIQAQGVKVIIYSFSFTTDALDK